MTNLPTDQRFVIILKGNARIWLNEQEFKAVKNALVAKAELLEIREMLINPYAILYVLPASELEIAEKIRRGHWQCEYGFWHERNQECGHGLAQMMNKTIG